MSLVGTPEKPLEVSAFALLFGRLSLSGLIVGAQKETQEMLDSCGMQNITVDIETLPIQKVNEAYQRLVKSEVKYRFSIDMAGRCPRTSGLRPDIRMDLKEVLNMKVLQRLR
ncbi:hypothetical protein [Methylomonas methanica]|uniref:hypothetical protein n=1 Tax=Methylomonas methanica TaxID=421 RepID=UPI0002FB0DEC|nr:hypothetical protein [Methylomonas methanica]